MLTTKKINIPFLLVSRVLVLSLVLLQINRGMGQLYQPSGGYPLSHMGYSDQDYMEDMFPSDEPQVSSGNWGSSSSSSAKKPIAPPVKKGVVAARKCVSCLDDEALTSTYCTSPTFRPSYKSGGTTRVCPANTFCDARILVDNYGCCCPLPFQLTTTPLPIMSTITLPSLTVQTLGNKVCDPGIVPTPNCNPCATIRTCTPASSFVLCIPDPCGRCVAITYDFATTMPIVCM